MASKKTSAKQVREDAENAVADDMFGGAFDGIEDLSSPPESVDEGHEESLNKAEKMDEPNSEESQVSEIKDVANKETEATQSSVEDEEANTETPESEPPSKSQTGPAKGPPKGPPSGPPKGPPKGPPSGPPKGPPKGPPSGPPKGPPKAPPSGPPSKNPEETTEEIPPTNIIEEQQEPSEPVMQEPDYETEKESGDSKPLPEDPIEEELETVESVDTELPNQAVEDDESQKHEAPSHEPNVSANVSNRALAAEKEVLTLSNEVASLRKSLSGAADVIEELETQPMPPAVLATDIVVPDHLVADIARLARQLERERLIRANMGSISMLHPGMPGVMISTKSDIILSRLNERGLVGGRLGQGSPEQAPTDWRILEVLLASTSLETGGPAACIHMMGPYTTAVSCEKDLILCTPIDEVGKKLLGKIIIVDSDDENPDDFLRQTAEALKQGGNKCVVIRGHGAYCVGADLDDAWANAAMLEHSMQIVLLTRQANLKV